MPHRLSLSLSQLIDGVWEQFRASLAAYLSITVWLLVPGLLFVIALLLYPTVDTLAAGTMLTGSQDAGTILYLLTKIVVLPLISLWAYVAIVRLASAQLRGGRGDARTAIRASWPRVLPVLGSSLLFGLALAAAYVGPLLPGFLLAIFTTGRYDAMWIALLRILLVLAGVVGSVFLSVRWFGLLQFGPLAVALDDAKATKSLAESARLVRGRFWPVIFRSVVAKLLFMMLGGAGLWIAVAVVNVGTSIAAASAPAAALRVNTLIVTLLSWIAVPMVVTPLLSLVDVHLYRNLKETV